MKKKRHYIHKSGPGTGVFSLSFTFLPRFFFLSLPGHVSGGRAVASAPAICPRNLNVFFHISLRLKTRPSCDILADRRRRAVPVSLDGRDDGDAVTGVS